MVSAKEGVPSERVLILRTRVEVLKRNLEQVERIVDSIQERRGELLEL